MGGYWGNIESEGLRVLTIPLFFFFFLGGAITLIALYSRINYQKFGGAIAPLAPLVDPPLTTTPLFNYTYPIDMKI